MSMVDGWTCHRPSTWIDLVHSACCADLDCHLTVPSAPEYFADLQRRYDATMSHLRSTKGIAPELVRKSLFFAKCMKKWRLPIDECGLSGEDRRRAAIAGWCERNLLAADDRYIPAYHFVMAEILNHWLPRYRGPEIIGRFGPGACFERYTQAQRRMRLAEWAAEDAPWCERPTGTHDVETTSCRLCAVPKDWNKDRLITVEPAFSSFLQQRVRRIIGESVHSGPLRGSAMDLLYSDGQAIQRRLALRASRTGSLATLDLSDASDSISWAAVQATFPSWVVDLLWSSRSTRYTGGSPAHPDGHIYMFGGMGNATTFIIETLFFSAYVVALQVTHGRRPWVSTFGDDIIVPNNDVPLILEEGDTPFFRVNAQKSFFGNDTMRESCGIFAYLGDDVTVPRVDGYTRNWCGALGLSDLHKRLVSSKDAFQHRLASSIAKAGWLENWPFYVEGYPSILDWSAPWSPLPKTRWNRDYQRREAYVLVAKDKTRRFPLWDYDSPAEDQSGLDARRRRESLPPASVWYPASLAGCLTTDEPSLRKFDPARPLRQPCAVFPTGKQRMGRAWRCVVRG